MNFTLESHYRCECMAFFYALFQSIFISLKTKCSLQEYIL